MDPNHRQLIKQLKCLKQFIVLDELKASLEISKIFTRNMLRDIYNQNHVCLFEELATRGPKAYELFIKVLEKAGYRTVAHILKKSNAKYIENNGINSEYINKTFEKSFGRCLLIANKSYDPQNKLIHFEEARHLDETFRKIGCAVELKTDLSQEGMLSVLDAFSSNDINRVDSCIIVIITHISCVDNCQVLYGNDGRYISEKEIIQKFDFKHCSSLIRKPKIFLFMSTLDSSKNDQSYCIFTNINNSRHNGLIINLFLKKATYISFCKILSSVLNCYHSYIDFETIVKCAYELFQRLSYRSI